MVWRRSTTPMTACSGLRIASRDTLNFIVEITYPYIKEWLLLAAKDQWISQFFSSKSVNYR
jgi:hypothetical protein